MYYIAAAILCFKHPKFGHEREWRLFCPVPTDKITHVGFGISENRVIRPYVELEHSNLNLFKEIWLGPGNPNDRDITRIYYQQKLGRPIPVTKSEIPLRLIE
jgi:hypothetical protein